MENALPLQVGKNWIKFSQRYLQTEKALVWVAQGQEAGDNDDVRVTTERELALRHYPHVPSGMWVGNPAEEGKSLMQSEMEPLTDEDGDGYFKLSTERWPAGVYRMNYHSLPGISSPVGTALSEQRDEEVSWPEFYENWPQDIREAMKPFIHKNRNGRGYCFRVLLRPDGAIEPFGQAE